MIKWLSTLVFVTFACGLVCGVDRTEASSNAFANSNAAVAPSTPQLTRILPRGIERGGEYVLQFRGERLEKAEEVFLYDPDGKITVVEVKPVDAKRVDVTINVAQDCRLGEHIAQIRTRDGISEFRSFYVGAMKEVQEKPEPNSSLETAQEIELDCTINGVITNEDIDYFRFTGKKGERVSVEVEAVRLGYMFDPAIALLDSERFEIAVSDDTPLTKQDAWFSVILPEDGDYYITIREASFRGNGECRYRLHVGRFARPTAVIPAGGKPGETLTLKFAEQLVGAEPKINWIEKEVTLPEQAGFRGGIFYEDEWGICPSPVPFRLSNLENVFETEGNNTFPDSPVIDLTGSAGVAMGVAINGIVNETGPLDFFRFKAKQGQVFTFTCCGRSIGSNIDSVINIYNASQQALAGNDDSRGLDATLRFQVPADGEYFVSVRDHMNRQREDFVYRLEIAPVSPSLSIGIQRNDRYSQNRQTIAVPQGNRFAVLVNASRSEFGGPIELIHENLLSGLTLHAVPMAANLNLMPVVFEADADAPLGGQLVDFRARHTDPSTNILGRFSNLADFVLGEPNNALYYSSTVDRLAMAVIEPLPFKLEIVQPKVPLIRNGSLHVQVIAHRDEGFDQPIRIFFPFLSPGVGTTSQQVIPEGQTSFTYPLNANTNAQLGPWPMYVIGSSDVNGPAWASSQLAELTIAEPFVKTDFERASVELGQTTKLYGKVEHLVPFEEEAIAEVIAVPANVEVQSPIAFDKETSELSFEVKTNEASPPGKHTLYCQITIVRDGEPMTFRTSDIQLLINKPVRRDEG